MPSSMTHTYFGIDVYNKLNKTSKNKIKDNIEYFKLFAQGSDPFMFYHFFIGKKAKKISNIQYMLHTTKTREFFISTINYIHNNNLKDNSIIMSYLYGYICHYYLDLYTHPLIYYKSGVFKKDNKNTYKYNGLHQEIEYAIDLYFIKNRESINSNKFKIHKEIFNVSSFTPELKNIIKYTIEDIYKVNNASDIYLKSIWYMKKFYRLANYDPTGIKLKIYSLIDRITPSNVIKLKELSFYNTYKDINNWLNLDNNIWYFPWDKNKSSTSSFIDLYNIAMDNSIKTIEEITHMLDNNKVDNKRLECLFNNLSYATGLNCNKKVNMKYFER